MDAQSFYNYCKDKDTGAEGKYHGEHLPSAWVVEGEKSKEQARFEFMFNRASTVIEEELPGLKERGWVESTLDADTILKRAWTQFARKSGIRADRPHLRPNLFNAFILAKKNKYAEPEIKNPGVGKGGNGGAKIELTDDQQTRMAQAMVTLANENNFDPFELEFAVVSIACEGNFGVDYTAEDESFTAVENALAEVESSAFLEAVMGAVAKLKEKSIKARTTPAVPSFEAIKKRWNAECQETYAGYLFYLKKASTQGGA